MIYIFYTTEQKSKICHGEKKMISMLEFLFDNIFVTYEMTTFQQIVGTPLYIMCPSEHLFFIHMKTKFFKIICSKNLYFFLFTYRYADDILLFHYPKFVKLSSFIYTPALEALEIEKKSSCA